MMTMKDESGSTPARGTEAPETRGDRRGDPTLIARCLRGDQRAWEVLVDRYSRLVYSIPRRYGLCDADAEEVHQQTFLALFRNLDKLRQLDRLSSWLITTAHRACWRVGRRQDMTALNDVIIDVGQPETVDHDRWERQHTVRLALDRLGGRCRDLLLAMFGSSGPPSYPAIAESLNMPVGSIGPTRARCFQKLTPILLDLGIRPDHADDSESTPTPRTPGALS